MNSKLFSYPIRKARFSGSSSLSSIIWPRSRVVTSPRSNPEEEILCARTVLSPSRFILLISNKEKILNNVNAVVRGQVKSENSSLPVAVCVLWDEQAWRKYNPFTFLHFYNQLATVTFTIFLFLSTNYVTNFPCIIFKYCNRFFSIFS